MEFSGLGSTESNYEVDRVARTPGADRSPRAPAESAHDLSPTTRAVAVTLSLRTGSLTRARSLRLEGSGRFARRPVTVTQSPKVVDPGTGATVLNRVGGIGRRQRPRYADGRRLPGAIGLGHPLTPADRLCGICAEAWPRQREFQVAIPERARRGEQAAHPRG